MSGSVDADECALQLRDTADGLRDPAVIGTLNSLAILSDPPGLDKWNSTHVTSGAGSFVMTAAGFDDFRQAIRQKRLREISPPFAWNSDAERQNRQVRRNLTLRSYLLISRLTQDDEKYLSYESLIRAHRGTGTFRKRSGRFGQR